MAVVAVADLFGISGGRLELVAALQRAQREAITHPGCERYTFAASIDDPDQFVLISEWIDQAALEAHYASAGFERFQVSLYGLLARPTEMTVYSVTGAVRPMFSGPMDPREAD